MPLENPEGLSRQSVLKVCLFLLFAGAAAYALFFTPLGALFLTPEGRKELVARIDLFIRHAGAWGPAVFILLYGAAVLFLPATPFSAAGALIFGKYLGAVYNLVGGLMGASISFFLARYFLRDFAKGFLVGKLADLDRKVGEHGFSVIFYLRILWFPFIVLNYAAGATRIRFGDYFLGTALGILPAVAIIAFFFGNLREIVASYHGPADLFQFDILFPAVLLVLSFFLPGLVNRFRKERGAAPTPADGA